MEVYLGTILVSRCYLESGRGFFGPDTMPMLKVGTEECDLCKGSKTHCREYMKQYLVGTPFERVAIDVMGPFPPTETGNRNIMVYMDYFTKWPEVYALPKQEALDF